MKAPKTFKELAEIARQSPGYYEQGAILDFTEAVVKAMKSKGVTKAQLANMIKASPAFVSKLLGGANNFTIATMVKVALALELELRISLTTSSTGTRSKTWKRGLQTPSSQTG